MHGEPVGSVHISTPLLSSLLFSNVCESLAMLVELYAICRKSKINPL